MNPDFQAIAAYTEKHSMAGIHAFTLDATSAITECRNFCPRYGIDEEAATCTSTGALTYYLYENKVIRELNKEFTFLQGNGMDRPSTIVTKLTNKEQPQIIVGGQAVVITKGEVY